MTLHEKLVNKIHEEQEQYLAKVEKLPPKEIILRAYEIGYREEIVIILESTEFTDEFTTKLLEMPKPIAYLYAVWLGMDGGVWDMLSDMIRSVEEEL